VQGKRKREKERPDGRRPPLADRSSKDYFALDAAASLSSRHETDIAYRVCAPLVRAAGVQATRRDRDRKGECEQERAAGSGRQGRGEKIESRDQRSREGEGEREAAWERQERPT